MRVRPFTEKERLFFDFDVFKNFEIYYNQFNFKEIVEAYKNREIGKNTNR